MRRASTRLAARMNDLAGWVFILCAGFITLDVLFRNFGGFSSSATTEITSYMLAFGIAWGLAHALAARAHIRVDVLVNKLPIAWRQYLHALALAVLTFLALFLAWCAWTLVDESVFFNATDTSALAIPLVIPQGLWAIGISMLAMQACHFEKLQNRLHCQHADADRPQSLRNDQRDRQRAGIRRVEEHTLIDQRPCAPSQEQRKKGQNSQRKRVQILPPGDRQLVDQDINTDMRARRQRMCQAPGDTEGQHVARDLGGCA